MIAQEQEYKNVWPVTVIRKSTHSSRLSSLYSKVDCTVNFKINLVGTNYFCLKYY